LSSPPAPPPARPDEDDGDPDRTRILPPPGPAAGDEADDDDDDPFRTRVLPEAPMPRPAGGPAPPRAPEPPRTPPPVRQAPPPPPAARPQPQAAQPPREKRPRVALPAWIALAAVAILAAAGGVVSTRGCRPADSDVVSEPAPPPPAAVANGTLTVSSLPAGARVVLRDANVAFTTDSTLADVPAGTHAVHAEKDGYLPRDTSIVVVAGEPARLVIELTPAPAATPCSLFVEVTPRADRVLVDSTQAAGGPGRFASAVAAGWHRITVQAEGYVPSSQRLKVRSGEARHTISVALQAGAAPPEPRATPDAATPPPGVTHEPASGSGVPMEVNVKPASDVFVDQAKVATGVTSTTLSLSVGTHTIRIENPDFAPVSKSVKVQAGSRLKPFKVDLTAGEGGLFVSGPRQGLRIYVDGTFTGRTTPDRVAARAGAHEVSVRESNGTTIVATLRVVVDPSRLGNTNVTFKP
jgi:hypothetical protein